MTLLWLRLRLSRGLGFFIWNQQSHRWKGGSIFIERKAYTENLRRLLLEERYLREPAVKRVCIWGMRGVGKTILAKAMALEDQVQHYFRNGIL
jgi:SpoVK/Ycf46/Vps4 family AAA+-type ATPase